MKLAQLLKEYKLPQEVGEIEVRALTLDSRRVESGSVFVALKGAKADGKNFIVQAIDKGAVAVFVEAKTFSVSAESDSAKSVPQISIPRLSARLSEFAGIFYGAPSAKLDVIGVTGTNGKSTCVSLLAQASELLGKPAWQLGTVGYGKPNQGLIDTGLTTPDAISCQHIFNQAQQEVELVAMEVSSHAVVQNRVRGVQFKGGVFTNITRDHLDFHGTFEAYCEAKLSFLRDYSLQYVVLNLDDEFAQRIVNEKLAGQTRIYSYALNNQKADVSAKIEQSDLQGVRALVSSPWGTDLLESSLVGDFNLSNLLAVVTALAANGFEFKKILEMIKYVRAVEGRLQKVELQDVALKGEQNAPAVFIDYAHTPDALLKALSALRKISSGELWVVFGCGGDRDSGKRPLMAQVAEQQAQHVIVTSDNPRTEDPQHIIADVVSGLANAEVADVFIDRKEAIEFAVQKLPVDACLLIAGKGHEKYQLIGDQRLPFDDYQIAQNALRQRFAVRDSLQGPSQESGQ